MTAAQIEQLQADWERARALAALVLVSPQDAGRLREMGAVEGRDFLVSEPQ
jgi:hypothetical protein